LKPGFREVIVTTGSEQAQDPWEIRLEALERKNADLEARLTGGRRTIRRMSAAWALAPLPGGGGGVAGAPQGHESIDAQEFVVKRPDGKTAIRMYVDSKGDPTLSLIDGKGVARMQLNLIDGFPFLSFGDENNRPRFFLAERGGTATVAMVDSNGKER